MAVKALALVICVAVAALHTTQGARVLLQGPEPEKPLSSFLTCKKAAFEDYSQKSWDDAGTGARTDFGTYYVEDKSSTSSPYKALSYFGFGQPARDLRSFLNNNPGRNAILCAPSKAILFRAPERFDPVWNDRGSGGSKDGAIWRPIPRKGYQCLGDVWTIGYSAPDISKAPPCVAAEIVEKCAAGGEVWNDGGSGARADLSLKFANQTLSDDPKIGTGWQRGNTNEFWCIKKDAIKTQYISSVNVLNITTISLGKSDLSSLKTARKYLAEKEYTNPTAGKITENYEDAWTYETSATLEFERELTVGFGTSTEITIGYEPAAIGGLKTEFKQAFTYQRDLRENTKTINAKAQTQSYKVSQQIEVPPFVSLTASAWVDYSSDVQVPVDAYFLMQAKDTVTDDTLTKADQDTFTSLLAANGFDGTVTGYDAGKESFIVLAKAKIKTALGLKTGMVLRCADVPNNDACSKNPNALPPIAEKPLVTGVQVDQTPAPTQSCSAAPAPPAPVTGCDSDTKQLICTCNKTISVTKATYGGAADNTCTAGGASSCTDATKVVDVTAAIKTKCQGTKTCDVKIYPSAAPFNGDLGSAADPCVNQIKKAVIEYTCV